MLPRTYFDLAVLAFFGLFAIRVVQKMKLALVPFGSSNFSDYSSMPLYFLLYSILNLSPFKTLLIKG